MEDTKNYKGFEIEIWNEESPVNPRHDWDNASTMVCFHKGYDLGDRKHGFEQGNYDSWDKLKAGIIEEKKPIAILPLFLYDHSGITMNTTGFSCGFDSMCVGFIYIDQKGCDDIGFSEEWAKEQYPDKTFEEALREVMVSDVEVYDQMLTGQVYGYTVEGVDDEDSCGGYFGYDHEKSGLLSDAKANIDFEIKSRIEARIEKVKEYIRAGVPMIYRKLPAIL